GGGGGGGGKAVGVPFGQGGGVGRGAGGCATAKGFPLVAPCPAAALASVGFLFFCLRVPPRCRPRWSRCSPITPHAVKFGPDSTNTRRAGASPVTSSLATIGVTGRN